MRTLCRVIGLTSLVLALPAPAAQAQETSVPREIGRTTEKELNVVLSSSFGTVIISKGSSEKICVVEYNDPEKEASVTDVRYQIRNRTGYLDLNLGEAENGGERRRSGFNLHGLSGGTWRIRFTDAVPISLDLELGVGKGEFDLTGLRVKDLNLSTGASDVILSFDEQNPVKIENMNIESGVSKFLARNLGNANFKHLKFQGGVGAYTLDFGGSLGNEVDVDVELGMGLMKLIIPQEVGAKIYYEKSWISRLDCDQGFESTGDNQYISSNYYVEPGRMNITIDSGMGSIKVARP